MDLSFCSLLPICTPQTYISSLLSGAILWEPVPKVMSLLTSPTLDMRWGEKGDGCG